MLSVRLVRRRGGGHEKAQMVVPSGRRFAY